MDIFELLATEIPLVESVSSYRERATKRISNEAAEEIRSKLPHVRSLVLNRETIRMIEEMISEDFPRDEDAAIDAYPNVGDKLDLSTASESTSSQTFLTNSLPVYQFPGLYLSGDSSAGQTGSLSPGQVLEFPGSLSGYDMF